MNRKIRTYLLMGLFLTAVGGMEQASAAEGQVYDLAPVTVTATRYASKDLNVGESTQIVTSEQLQQTGQTKICSRPFPSWTVWFIPAWGPMVQRPVL